MEILGRVRLVDEDGDAFVWTLHNSKVFTVSSFYDALVGRRFVDFLRKAIWCSGASRKVTFFAWTTTWGAILTLDYLQKGVCLWLIDVACVGKRSQSTTFLFTAR
uniref:Reverse transcriptase zinc-binding domain-containing protein n=1 Tax=Davidia involucrata TaxID=16924 RepID=A0A5B7BLK1_DAVIN